MEEAFANHPRFRKAYATPSSMVSQGERKKVKVEVMEEESKKKRVNNISKNEPKIDKIIPMPTLDQSLRSSHDVLDVKIPIGPVSDFGAPSSPFIPNWSVQKNLVTGSILPGNKCTVDHLTTQEVLDQLASHLSQVNILTDHVIRNYRSASMDRSNLEEQILGLQAKLERAEQLLQAKLLEKEKELSRIRLEHALALLKAKEKSIEQFKSSEEYQLEKEKLKKNYLEQFCDSREYAKRVFDHAVDFYYFGFDQCRAQLVEQGYTDMILDAELGAKILIAHNGVPECPPIISAYAKSAP